MNFPNVLTVFRIILGCLLPFLLIYDDFGVRVFACVVFVIASATDWLDGWYARKYKMITTVGKILDPIADKIMVLGAFFTFAFLGMYSALLILPILLRELIITVYRLIFLREKKVVAAASSGKLKTVVQMGTLGFLYIFFMLKRYYKNWADEYGLFSYLIHKEMMYFLLLVCVGLTLYSGYSFFSRNWKLVKKTNKEYFSL